MEKLININLLRIKNAKGESLHKTDFEIVYETQTVDLELLLHKMEEEHLIETEQDPDIYFLTELSYQILEAGGSWIDVNNPDQTTKTYVPNDPLTLSNFRETLEKATQSGNRKNVYGLIWLFIFAIGALLTANYLIDDDEAIQQEKSKMQERKAIIDSLENEKMLQKMKAMGSDSSRSVKKVINQTEH